MSDDYINRISVRNLVEFIMRSGDIDNRSGKGLDKDAMLEGTRLHKKIQKRMGINYHAEVSLKYLIETKRYNVLLEGRADGIIIDTDKVTIDEIKCLYKELELIDEPVLLHKSQALCYAYIYSKQNDLDCIEIQMTYCNIITEQVKYFREEYTFNELEEWFNKIISDYLLWIDFQYDWSITMSKSAKEIEFPFQYRKGQKEIAVSVYKTFLRKKNLFIQAPTGVGKTMSVLFPSIKALGERTGEKIFYLTAKTITAVVARESIEILNKKGLKVKTVCITAKDKMCPKEETECNPEYCEFAKGHYDRINKVVYDFITSNDCMYREDIYDYAVKHMVCPFEMNLDIATWCDVIICDYNYAFDVNVKLKRFFADGIKRDYLFLIDEAHNLVERGRQMYSAQLIKEDFLKIKNKVKNISKRLSNSLEKCNTELLEFKRECDDYIVFELPGFSSENSDECFLSISQFTIKLMRMFGELEKFREDYKDESNDKEIVEFYLNVRHFLNILEYIDENYVIYAEHNEDGNFMLKLFCINPSVNLKECIDKGRSAVFFSATLLPISYYKSLLTVKEDDYAIYIDSPFDKKNRLIAIGEDVSTKYTRRNKNEFLKMAEYILNITKAKKGNYLVFFPSYKLMNDVIKYLKEMINPDVLVLVQNKGMREEEREEFLDFFTDDSQQSVLGLCVMGGIFSEGIDLKEERLIGAIVIGTGLPQISNERKILKDFYDNMGMNGFDYAYIYPGMNKVLQSAGRVIRTAEDKGVIMLLDSRFCDTGYNRLFPREWDNYYICNINNSKKCINDFWNRLKGDESEKQ